MRIKPGFQRWKRFTLVNHEQKASEALRSPSGRVICEYSSALALALPFALFTSPYPSIFAMAIIEGPAAKISWRSTLILHHLVRHFQELDKSRTLYTVRYTAWAFAKVGQCDGKLERFRVRGLGFMGLGCRFRFSSLLRVT